MPKTSKKTLNSKRGRRIPVRVRPFKVLSMHRRNFEPIHPGDILLEGFLNPMAISQYRLAKDIRGSGSGIGDRVKGSEDRVKSFVDN